MYEADSFININVDISPFAGPGGVFIWPFKLLASSQTVRLKFTLKQHAKYSYIHVHNWYSAVGFVKKGIRIAKSLFYNQTVYHSTLAAKRRWDLKPMHTSLYTEIVWPLDGVVVLSSTGNGSQTTGNGRQTTGNGSQYLLLWLHLFLVLLASSEVRVGFDVVLRVPRFQNRSAHAPEEPERASFLLRLILVYDTLVKYRK